MLFQALDPRAFDHRCCTPRQVDCAVSMVRQLRYEKRLVEADELAHCFSERGLLMVLLPAHHSRAETSDGCAPGAEWIETDGSADLNNGSTDLNNGFTSSTDGSVDSTNGSACSIDGSVTVTVGRCGDRVDGSGTLVAACNSRKM